MAFSYSLLTGVQTSATRDATRGSVLSSHPRLCYSRLYRHRLDITITVTIPVHSRSLLATLLTFDCFHGSSHLIT